MAEWYLKAKMWFPETISGTNFSTLLGLLIIEWGNTYIYSWLEMWMEVLVYEYAIILKLASDFNRSFTEEETQMANKCVKKCSKPLSGQC